MSDPVNALDVNGLIPYTPLLYKGLLSTWFPIFHKKIAVRVQADLDIHLPYGT